MPHLDSPDVSVSLEARAIVERRRRAHVAAAVTFGAIGFFGVADFIGAVLQDRLTDALIVRSVSAAVSGIAALVLWRESRRLRVPNEELKPTATPSSLVK